MMLDISAGLSTWDNWFTLPYLHWESAHKPDEIELVKKYDKLNNSGKDTIYATITGLKHY